MIHKPAAPHDTPVPESRTQRSEERDTLNDTPELRFLRDEIEALLGAPAVRRALQAPSINYADHEDLVRPEPFVRDLADAEDEDTGAFGSSIFDRETEPSIDAQLVREAIRAAGK